MEDAAEFDAVSLLGQAQEALQAGDWSAAKEKFEVALTQEESAEALFGLGNALWWLGETEASVRYYPERSEELAPAIRRLLHEASRLSSSSLVPRARLPSATTSW